MKKLSVIMLVLVMVSAVFVNAFADDDFYGGEITYIIALDNFGILDPHINSTTQNNYVFDAVFDTLITQDDGKFYPGLAKAWSHNDDFTEWTLELRDDVTFHDGSKFNAEVVKYNFERMINPELKSKQAAGLISSYDYTEIVDDYKVIVHFTEPFALFEVAMISDALSMVSMEWCEEHGLNSMVDHMVGTGPFMFESMDGTNELVVVKNPDYNWAPEFFDHQGPAYLDKVTFRWVNETEARMGALEVGEAQIVDETPPNRVEDLQDAGFNIIIWNRTGFPRNGVVNVSIFPTDDINVRKAMIYGFNYEKMVKTITLGVFPAAHNIMSPGTMFYDENCELYEYNPEKAVELLEASGWTEFNSDGYRVKDGKVLEALYYVQPKDQSAMIAEAFQNDMKQIGIKIDAQIISGSLHYSISDADSPCNISDLGAGAPDPGLLLKTWFHSSGNLYSHFTDEKTDALIEAGLRTNDIEERQKVYSELQCYLMENAVEIPMSVTVRPWALSPDIDGFKADMYPIPHLYDVHYVK